MHTSVPNEDDPELPRRLHWLSRHMTSVLVVSVAVFLVPSLLQWAFTGRLVFGDFLDVTVYRAGGAALLHGEPLYAADLPVGTGSFPFTYPPFAAAVFAPMALVPAWLCRALVIPVHIGLLTAVVRRCLRCTGHPDTRRLRRAALTVAGRAHADGRVLLGLTLCGLTSTAVSPFSWSHHWVWIAPLVVLPVTHASRALLVCLAVLTFAWPVHVVLGLDVHFPVLGISALPSWHGLEILYGNAYLIVFAGALVATHRALNVRTATLRTPATGGT